MHTVESQRNHGTVEKPRPVFFKKPAKQPMAENEHTQRAAPIPYISKLSALPKTKRSTMVKWFHSPHKSAVTSTMRAASPSQ